MFIRPQHIEACQGLSLLGWLSPTSLFAGALAVAVCAYLAAVFRTADAGLTPRAAVSGNRSSW